MKITTSHRLQIEVQDLQTGKEAVQTVVLITGLGMQLSEWPFSWIEGWMNQGFRVILLDNRDAGLSDSLIEIEEEQPPPWQNLFQKDFLEHATAPYTLGDMAQDVVDVLDALQVKRCHVVGMSMGGMIAQQMAIKWGERLQSLSCLMSSSNAPGLALAPRSIWRALFDVPDAGASLWAHLKYVLHLRRVLSAHTHGSDEAINEVANKATYYQTLLRSKPSAWRLYRQLLAITLDRDRFHLLAQVATPTLVVHGVQDPFLPLAHGRDLASRLGQGGGGLGGQHHDSAQFIAIDGMGHDLSPTFLPTIFHSLVSFQYEHF